MIHKYKLNGYNICLDVHSGAVHVLDDIAYDVLDFCGEGMGENAPEKMYAELSGKYDKEELTETYEALYELYEMGQLFSSDDYEQFADLMTKAPIKSMCINISHDCNLRCEYCFAAKGDFGQGRCLMSFETAKKAIDFIIANSGTRHNLEVDFFGGEPLMNFDVVKQTVEYARSIEKEHNKNFRFTITTNGLLLDDEKIDYINKEMSNVVLSLDGRKEINDKLRVTPNGKGCYDIIVPKYQKLGHGSGAIQDFLIPLVRSNGGNLITVTTNSEKNVAFYIDNGFKLVKEETLECKAKSIGNWTFRMDL